MLADMRKLVINGYTNLNKPFISLKEKSFRYTSRCHENADAIDNAIKIARREAKPFSRAVPALILELCSVLLFWHNNSIKFVFVSPNINNNMPNLISNCDSVCIFDWFVIIL